MADLPTLRAKVEAVQALAAKATRGPWRSAGDCQSGGLDYVHVEVPIRPEQNVSEAILATIKRYGAHKEKAEGNADLMAAAPDLVTLATDLLVALEAAQAERDEARAELTAIRAALGNGADEAAWPPGLTMAEAVGRLREVLLGCAYELGVREYNGLHGAPKSDDDWSLSSQDAYASAFAQAYVSAEQKDNGGPNG